MTTHNLFLEWNTLSIQDQIVKHLSARLWKVDTSLGFADSGESAFILEARKDHVAMIIDLENEGQTIQIRGGLHGDYLPIGKGIPKFKGKFKHTEIKEASLFFVKVENWCSDHFDNGLMNERAQAKFNEMAERDSQ